MTKFLLSGCRRFALFLARKQRASATLSMAAVVLPLLAMCIAPMPCMAQVNTGTISGTVTDARGDIVVKANAKLTSSSEGTVKEVPVNARGEYLFDDVKAGTYTLTVSAPTFQKYTADSVVVNDTENVRIDAKLILGSEDVTVTVEAPSVSVDTRSATVAAVIDPTLVQNLPIDGNNVIALTALLPGVTNVNAPATFTSDTGGPSYIVSGSRANQNLFLFDGILWNNVYYNTGLGFPPQFMIHELSVQLANFKAQYGRNVGSVLNVLTRSGSNQFHGALWEYLENSAFNSRDYISHVNPQQVQNQFGATIGGPILRDKLFFFLGWQDLRVAQQVNSVLGASAVPANIGLNLDGTPRQCVTPAYIAAGAVSCASFTTNYPAGSPLLTSNPPSAGVRNPLYFNNPTYYGTALSQLQSTFAAGGGVGTSPCVNVLQSLGLTAQFLPNQEIPSTCFNPVTMNIYRKYISLPNATVPFPETVSAKSPRNDQLGLARVDWNLGRHTIDTRFYVTNVNDNTSNAVGPTGQAIASYEIDTNQGGVYTGNIGDTWVVRPNLLNVARLSYKRYNYTILPTDPTTIRDLGSNFSEPGHPSLPRINVSAAFNLGSSNSGYSYSVNAGYEASDSVSWTHGNHNIQAGAQFLDLDYIHRFDQVPYFGFSNSYTSLGTADFLMGLIFNETVGNSTNIGAVEHAGYFYAQDDWGILPRLTLNLGLRYELAKPWYQPDGQSVTWIPGYQSYKFLNTPASLAFQGDPGVPDSIIKTTYNNLAPRFGFAYDVFGNGRMAIRGGFGIFFDALNANTTGVGEPYHYQATYQQPNGSLSNPLLGQDSVPSNYTGPSTAKFGEPYTVNFADPNVTQPYTEAVNLGVQQKILSATLDVIYVGKFGRHQIVPYDLNPTIYDCKGAYFQKDPLTYCTNANTTQASAQARVRYPGFNYGGQGIVDNNSVGSSNYNGLQAIYTQRSKSLTMTASYTYSRSLDDQSNGTTNSSTLPSPPNVNNNYGPSDFQTTHVFNMGWVLKLPNSRVGSRLQRAVLNDWTFSGIFNARTGQPFNVVNTSDNALSGEPNQRPPLAPGLTHYDPGAFGNNRHRADKVQQYFNICSFLSGNPSMVGGVYVNNCSSYRPNTNYGITPGYTNGVSRNLLYGPAFLETDAGLQRSVALPEHGMRLIFRAEAINAFNTPNLANPISGISGNTSTAQSTDNGSISATVGKNGGVGTNGRRIQLSLQLNY